jgi:penicillin-binding protein-related factor A (putative recombinase)
MLERNFSSQFRKEYKMRYPQSHVVLLQDAPKGGKKPYDAYMLQGGIFTAIEFKVEKGASIKLDCLKVHQFESLVEVERTGGNAMIVVLCEKIKKTLACTVSEWHDMFTLAESHLIKFEDVEQPLFIERLRYDEATTWDMKRFRTLAWQ